MIALIALLERNGSASSDQSGIIAQLQLRISQLETENARLRNGGDDLPHSPADA